MSEFDQDRYLRIQTGAVQAGQNAADIITKYVAQGHDRIVFSGTGGASILMEPAARWLTQMGHAAAHIPAPDAMAHTDARIGRGAVVVVPSLSGTTSESIEFCAWAQALGATVVALCGHADTPVAKNASHAQINFAEDDTSSESFYIQSLAIAAAWAKATGGADIGLTPQAMAALPHALLDAKMAITPQIETWAQFLELPGPVLFTGAGSCWPQAHYFAMCILEEMQWIPTRPIDASLFFHGTLELLDRTKPLVILHGEDGARGLTERVERFAADITNNLWVLDSRTARLPDVPKPLRPFVAPMVHAAWLERISARLAQRRGHPLTTRRYYRRMSY